MKLTLLVLAAGMGSRYGGLKQLDEVGPSGETVMDYSVFDAMRAGFDRVVFVIRKDIEEAFRAAIGSRYADRIEVAYAFQDLNDLPGARLHETIPDFHNTPKRVEALIEAVDEDRVGRAAGVRREIDFVLERREETELLLKLHAEGAIPERITHNDTKVNNILIDDLTGEGICVIDLDTVMPGLALYDFGDMVRAGTSAAEEDEVNLEKVGMRFEMYEALFRGFLSSAGGFLTPAERENLPFAGKLITLETAIRFLTDYLEGDVYFKTRRPHHNLDRCRTQLKLVASIEEQYDAMRKLADELA